MKRTPLNRTRWMKKNFKPRLANTSRLWRTGPGADRVR